jgi:cell division septum initiation protein DivIVA
LTVSKWEDAGVADTETLPLLSEVATTPSFRLAFRGYDSREVDRYANYMESEVEAAAAVHQQLAADVRSLTEQLERAHEELAHLRRRPTVDDEVSFRHLGPRVEQILAEAQAEAEAIRAAANEHATREREAAEAHARAVQAEHARAITEAEQRQQQLRNEEERWTLRLRDRQDAVARAEAYRTRVRRDAEELLATAQAQHERVIASALARSEQVLTRAAAWAAQTREQALRDADALVAEVEQAVEQTVTDHPAKTRRLDARPKRAGRPLRATAELKVVGSPRR